MVSSYICDCDLALLEKMIMEKTIKKGSIYIGGLDRSGKTTMRSFLASHPNISIPAVGSNMWTYFYNQFGDLKNQDNFERCLEAMLKYKHVRFLQPDPDRIRQAFWEGEPTYARLFSLFLIHFAENEGKPRWGAQTVLIERYADQLFSAYPGLKIIHMTRDPRDRYEASIALWPKGKGRAGGAVTRWIYSTRLAERHLKRYPDHYKIVRFESLISDPEKTLREVCDFLDENYLPTMLAMDGASTNFRSKLMKGKHLEFGESPLSKEYIGKFRENLSEREIAFIQLHAGKKMQAYDYPMEPIDFSPIQWLSFGIIELPNQWFRMLGWFFVEVLQQNFPGLVGRNPGQRMIIDAPLKPVEKTKKG